MKTIFLFTCIVLLSSIHVEAQLISGDTNREPSEFYFSKGDNAINLNIGLLNASDFSFNLFQASGSGDPSPSIQLTYEYGLYDQFSIAGFTSFYTVKASTSISYQDLSDQISAIDITDFGSIITSLNCILNPSECGSTIEERVNVFTLGVKLRYHKPILENFDTYAATYVGYSFNRRKTITETVLQGVIEEVGLKTEIPNIVYFGSVGIRYFVTSKIGIWAEYGIGNVHLLNLGLTYRY